MAAATTLADAIIAEIEGMSTILSPKRILLAK
jgi:hypothetical protein